MILDIRYNQCTDEEDFQDEYNIHGDNAYGILVKPLLSNINARNVAKIINYTTRFDMIIQDEINFITTEDMLKAYLFEEYEIDGKYTYLLDKSKPEDVRKIREILNYLL